MMGAVASPAVAASQVSFNEGSHTWVVPSGITSIDLAIMGAGGGSAKYGTPEASASGGAGAKVTVKSLKVNPGETIKFAVGTGGSSLIPNGGGGGGAATIAYKGSPNSSGLLVVAGGGGGGGSVESKTVGKGADGAANKSAPGGSTAGNPTGVDAGCGGSNGGKNGNGGTIPDKRSCVTGTDDGVGDNGFFGNGGAGGNGSSGGSITETGSGTGGAGGESGAYGGGGGGGGFGGGAGGVAKDNPVNTGVGGAAGGSGVFNAAAKAKVTYAPGNNGGTNSQAGGNGSVLITWGSSAPGKPRAVKVSGKPTAAKRTVSWKAPKTGTVTKYIVKIRVQRTKKLVYTKSVNSKTRKISVSRKTLLKKTFRARGEVRGNITYIAQVYAVNGTTQSKAGTARFVVRS